MILGLAWFSDLVHESGLTVLVLARFRSQFSAESRHSNIWFCVMISIYSWFPDNKTDIFKYLNLYMLSIYKVILFHVTSDHLEQTIFSVSQTFPGQIVQESDRIKFCSCWSHLSTHCPKKAASGFKGTLNVPKHLKTEIKILMKKHPDSHIIS